MNYRTGIGYDIHRLEKGYDLNLGGVVILHHKGTVGHSDGDVLIHAICDALLGAANLHDIGYHFPDNSPEFKNIDSKILLNRTVRMLTENNYSIVNIDSTICLEHPRVKDSIPVMKETLATVMDIESERISIKATTSEKLGYIGNEEGLAAYAIVLIEKKEKQA
ncbi:MAG: 2-C-methyl-D-erythritol 2,4-cyclodiphosphate synthase [Bacteroidales bacterium]|nr:MAG: 2-C-methyl-D-erythritol 2,4-cyclodiphosphate synthase [Bacteroidales bacterium]